jgi:hypothetical protein
MNSVLDVILNGMAYAKPKSSDDGTGKPTAEADPARQKEGSFRRQATYSQSFH